MVKIISVISLLMLSVSAFAEPFSLQQAGNVLKPGQFEIGVVDASYGYEKWTVVGKTGDYTSTVISIPFFAKYSLTDTIEAKCRFPYLMTTSTAPGVSDVKENGIGSGVVGLKYNFKELCGMSELALAVDADLPTGDAKKGLGEGTNVAGTAIFSTNFDPLKLNLNVGYKYTTEFTAAGDTKVNTGELLYGGIGLEYPMDTLNLIVEFTGSTRPKTKYNGVEQSDTIGGLRYDIIPGIRLQNGDLKFKLGVAIALGEATYRTYDFNVIAGISYLFQL